MMDKVKDLSKAASNKAKDTSKEMFTPKTQPQGFLNVLNKATGAGEKIKKFMTKLKLYLKLYAYGCLITWMVFAVLFVVMLIVPPSLDGVSDPMFKANEIGIEPQNSTAIFKNTFGAMIKYLYGEEIASIDANSTASNVGSFAAKTSLNASSSATMDDMTRYGLVKIARDSLLLNADFQLVKNLLIVLSITLIGALFTIGKLEMKMKDVMGLCFKLTIVAFMTNPSSIEVYDNYILKPIMYTMEAVVMKMQDSVFSAMGKSGYDVGATPFDTIDAMFGIMFTKVFFFKMMAMYVTSATVYAMFIVLIAFCLYQFMWLAKDILLFLIMAKMSMCFAFILMPVMILLFLFSATRSIGESFFGDFLMEPIMTYILYNLFLSILLAILLEPLYAILNFTVTKYSLLDAMGAPDWTSFLLILCSPCAIIFGNYYIAGSFDDAFTNILPNIMIFTFFIWFFKENIPLVQSMADKLANAFNFNPASKKNPRGDNPSAMMKGASAAAGAISKELDSAPRKIFGGVQKDANGNVKTDKYGNVQYDKGLLSTAFGNPKIGGKSMEAALHGKGGFDKKVEDFMMNQADKIKNRGVNAVTESAKGVVSGFKEGKGFKDTMSKMGAGFRDGFGSGIQKDDDGAGIFQKIKNWADSDEGLQKQGYGIDGKLFASDKARRTAEVEAREILKDNDNNHLKARDEYVKKVTETNDSIDKKTAEKQFWDLVLNFTKEGYQGRDKNHDPKTRFKSLDKIDEWMKEFNHMHGKPIDKDANDKTKQKHAEVQGFNGDAYDYARAKFKESLKGKGDIEGLADHIFTILKGGKPKVLKMTDSVAMPSGNSANSSNSANDGMPISDDDLDEDERDDLDEVGDQDETSGDEDGGILSKNIMDNNNDSLEEITGQLQQKEEDIVETLKKEAEKAGIEFDAEKKDEIQKKLFEDATAALTNTDDLKGR
jgi:hypothetical protein